MDIKCSANPECREDLIVRISKRISIKAFLTGTSAILTILTFIGLICYSAYGGRMERIESAQLAQQKRIEAQSKDMSNLQGDIRVLSSNQTQIMKSLNEIKGLVKQLIVPPRLRNQ